jgi:hypothetical protein
MLIVEARRSSHAFLAECHSLSSVLFRWAVTKCSSHCPYHRSPYKSPTISLHQVLCKIHGPWSVTWLKLVHGLASWAFPMTINTGRSHPCSIARLKLAHGLASSLIQCHQCWMPLAVPQLDLVRLLFYGRSQSMHDLALMVDLLCPRFNGNQMPSLPSVIPYLQSFSTELLPSVPVIVLTSLLVRLQPFLWSKAFAIPWSTAWLRLVHGLAIWALSITLSAGCLWLNHNTT